MIMSLVVFNLKNNFCIGIKCVHPFWLEVFFDVKSYPVGNGFKLFPGKKFRSSPICISFSVRIKVNLKGSIKPIIICLNWPFFVTLSRQNIGFGDEVQELINYIWFLDLRGHKQTRTLLAPTYYSQSWSRKSGLCENCIPTSSSFRLPYALLALAKIGKVSETEFHGPTSLGWLRWKRRGG